MTLERTISPICMTLCPMSCAVSITVTTGFLSKQKKLLSPRHVAGEAAGGDGKRMTGLDVGGAETGVGEVTGDFGVVLFRGMNKGSKGLGVVVIGICVVEEGNNCDEAWEHKPGYALLHL